MSEQPLLNVSDDTSLGKVEIAPEVIEVIAGIAATEVKAYTPCVEILHPELQNDSESKLI